MSFEYGFYNSVNHDRKYAAEQISRIFDGIITDGVYATIGEAFSVTANTGMQLSIGSGRAWFNHTWSYNDTIALVTVPASHAVFDRIDAVVIEINLQNRENRLTVVKGVESSEPTKPVLSAGEDDTWQYPLAYINVTHSVTEITSDAIDPAVGTSACPFVAGVLQGINIDYLIATWKNQFDVLFVELEQQIAQAVSQTLIDGSVTFPKLAGGTVNRFYENVTVSADENDWVEDTTEEWSEDYPFRCDIPVAGITESYIVECIFAYQQIQDGLIFACPRSYNGGFSIWASDIPESSFDILQVEARRVKA